MTPKDYNAFSAENIGNNADVVVEPSHYTRFSIDPVTFIMENDLEFWRGNIVKYAVRAGFKSYPDCTTAQSEITDLKKAIRYAEMRINMLENRTITAK